MSTYSVADAKNGLSKLIDRALNGEEVVISRHGKPVAELRPMPRSPVQSTSATYEWLKSRRRSRKSVKPTSVELIRQMYENPDV